MTRVVLNYWAAARAAAGIASETFEASSIRAVLALARDAHPERSFGDVLAASSLMVDGQVVHEDELDLPVVGGSVEIEVLPPFAGG